MSVFETKIVTVGWDESTGMFDDSALRSYLAEREVIRSEPRFFQVKGRPYWSVYLETRTLRGAERLQQSSPPKSKGSEQDHGFGNLLSELDEVQRVRFEKIVAWRRDVARRDGTAAYVVCDNRQAMELARKAPRTMQGLAGVKGFGAKRLQKYGKELLEVLHGGSWSSGSAETDSVRAVDGQHEVDSGTHAAVPETAETHADRAPGEDVSGDPGRSDDRGVQPTEGGQSDAGG